VVDDSDAIAQAFGFVHVVRGQQDGSPCFLEAADNVPQLASRLWIESRCRLVHEKKFWIADQRTGNGEALLLSARKLADSGVEFLVQGDLAQRFFRRNALPIEAAKERQRFEYGQFLGEFRFLQRNADLLTYLVVGLSPFHSQNFDFTAACFQQALQDFDRRGLAGAVRPKKSETFADANRKIQAVDGIHWGFAGVLFVKLATNNGVGHRDIMPKDAAKSSVLRRSWDVMTRLVAVVFFYLMTVVRCAYGMQDTLSEAQIKELIRSSADKDVENTKRERDYTYIRRDEERKLDNKGQVKSTESNTYEIMVLAGEHAEKLIAKDDKSLSEKEAKKEDDKIQKLIAKGEKESESDRKKRLAKSEKETEEARQFVREVADAYKFHFRGMEDVLGRPAYVIDADPLPGYKPRLKDAKILPKVRMRLWIDKAEQQWVKIDIECIETFSIGLFLARVNKGSTIHVEQTRVNDEVWLPRHLNLKVDAKIALLKNFDAEYDITFHDYQKFRTDAVIRPLGEVSNP
jgi:hypothetical protein